ncbi:hypothetical protein JX265_005730 [Neoarthrinium moseri]|uniref:GH16 domain-containing protein n=1 Tax=Neoarthrinium moseri TaxID=1658444 RepID=A0A9P9WN91_9PEZI|nr:uncharacterized protein JN550_013396 [Neoarthrinium moseri]KAI1842153.1 hypothetical protein JX266_011686 [Neoarthrinium moseri]KAI1857213.1 hypothetical protein JN550_013396 [Neoarthrinium moseri]KAI1871744.1 hypothetical protein JX265_005730 [Neoarthrinium moseri]
MQRPRTTVAVQPLGCTLFLLLACLLNAAAATNCSAFATNGSAAAQYSYYRFYDFRNLPEDTWQYVKNASDPNNGTAGASTTDMGWSLDWQRRNGLLYAGEGSNLLPIDYQMDKVAPRNLTQDEADPGATTALGLYTSRQQEDRHQSSGIDFNEEKILYLSLRVRARVSGAAGACTAFFTYANDTQEADIELLTRDEPHIVGFNTQPSIDIHGNYINATHFNTSLPNGLSRDQWVNYRMDWVSDHVVWYIDGEYMGNTSTHVPVEPSHLYITMWGNGGTWTENMTLGDSALLEIQWIEVAYNLSGAEPTVDANAAVCNLDEAKSSGSWNPQSLPAPHHYEASAGYKLGMSTLFMLAAVLFTL